jgi:uncharacterized repeat protein (TIGR01451 family)
MMTNDHVPHGFGQATAASADQVARRPRSGFVRGVREVFDAALRAVLFTVLLTGLSLPAAAATLFTTQTPAATFSDGPYELGMKFQSSAAGTITAIRYYKDPGESATGHVGHLWDASGNLLATVNFSGESASGWQQQGLSAAVAIQAGKTYVVSVNSVSNYVATAQGLAAAVVNASLSSVADGANGVYGNPGVFPNSSFNSTNYFRDVVFQPNVVQASQCISGEKYVSVNGPGGPFVRNSVTSNNPNTGAANPLIASVPGANDVPAASVNIPTGFFGGTKVFYQFVITNCGNVDLYNVRLDDCIDVRSVGASGFLTGGVGAAGEANCEQPRMIPASPQRIVAPKLSPGQAVTVTSASFPSDYISSVDICGTYGSKRTNGIVRNDSQVEADADLNGDGIGETFVNFDDLNLVQCAPQPSASIKLLKQISVDGGITWFDADSAATAPAVTAPAGALYRFIVTNTGNVNLTNVSISDPALGLTSVVIPSATLTPGQSVTIVSGTSGFSSLSQPTRCNLNTIGNITNIATVTGTPASGGANVTDTNPAVLICQAPPPQCSASSSIASNFNGTQIPAGDSIWFNSNFKPSGVKDGTTVTLTGGSVQFASNGTSYNVPVPNAVVTFSSSVTCATTSFNSSLSRWETTVPLNVNTDDIFVSGMAFKVPANFQKGINPVTWNATFGTNTPGVQVNWKWGAAAYTQFPSDYNQLNVKPTHAAACGYTNGDQAGTPESSYKSYVTGGARGGGGSNWTGSWSGTVSGLNLVCQ